MKKASKILKRWYLLFIAGVFYILSGISAFVIPVGSFITFALFISVGIFLSGVIEFFYSLLNKQHIQNWGWQFAGSIFSILLGFFLLMDLQLTLSLFVVLIGFWILFRSFSIFPYAFDMKRRGEKRWGWILSIGVLALLISTFLLFNPLFLGTMVGIWVGICLVIIGAVHILISLFLNKINKLRKSVVGQTEEYVEISSKINESYCHVYL